MRNGIKIFFGFLLIGIFLSPALSFAQGKRQAVLVRVFHLPTCSGCIKVIQSVLPPIAQKYGDRIRWEYIDVSNVENYKKFLDVEQKTGKQMGTPAILIGDTVLVGVNQIADSLDADISAELKLPGRSLELDNKAVNLLERFKSFGPLTVIGAGLEDGINPCAFTVIVFFISFLTFMGYRRKETALIGSTYILGVFLTYLVMGFGIFKILYTLKFFYLISRILYLVIGGASLFFGYLALRDYVVYKRTGKTEGMALQLPKVIKNKIHSIVGKYYRKDKNAPKKGMAGLFLSALIVGFLVSLIEAVCTGQLYLPTIVFILKEGSLRARALFYLVIYNLMFIVPLILVLLLALFGVSSKQFEGFALKHMGFIKIAMAVIFFALGIFLLLGI